MHLIPKFGRVMDKTWAMDNVLELCKFFYVNYYFHHLDFLLFCYLLSWILFSLLWLNSRLSFPLKILLFHYAVTLSLYSTVPQ